MGPSVLLLGLTLAGAPGPPEAGGVDDLPLRGPESDWRAVDQDARRVAVAGVVLGTAGLVPVVVGTGWFLQAAASGETRGQPGIAVLFGGLALGVGTTLLTVATLRSASALNALGAPVTGGAGTTAAAALLLGGAMAAAGLATGHRGPAYVGVAFAVGGYVAGCVQLDTNGFARRQLRTTVHVVPAPVPDPRGRLVPGLVVSGVW